MRYICVTLSVFTDAFLIAIFGQLYVLQMCKDGAL